MKWFVYFFASFILVLSGIPCSAGDDCCKDECETGATSHQNDHKPMSPCAPFFACGAYHGVTIPDNNIEFLKTVPPVTELEFFYKEALLPDFSPAIWQPPKKA
jgi:hypothetical protein